MLRIADGRTFAPDEDSLECRGVGFLGVTSGDEAPDEVFVAGLRCPPECCGHHFACSCGCAESTVT